MGVIRLLNMMETDDAKLWEKIEEIYLTSFPECERKPFALIKGKMGTDAVDILAFVQAEQIVGLAVTMKYKDLVLLDYFAIDAGQRGNGCGSAAIRLLQERFSDKKFYLEIESLKEPSENMAQRKKRKAFFLRNGMHATGRHVRVSGTAYEILSYHEPPTYEEYVSVYKYAYGADGCRDIIRQG